MLYNLASKEDCLRFRNFADSIEGFDLRYDDKEVMVWDRKVPGESMNIVKVFAFFPVAPETLWQVLQESVYRLTWDVVCKKLRRVARMNPTNDISYYAAKSPPGISDRDVLCQRAWHNVGGGEYVILNTSVKHPSVKEKMGYTRACSKLSGYFIQPQPDGTSSLVFITQTDPKGLIPHAVMNLVTTKFVPDTMRNLKKAAAGYLAWKEKNADAAAADKDWDMEPDGWGVPVSSHTLAFVKSRWSDAAPASPVVPAVPELPTEAELAALEKQDEAAAQEAAKVEIDEDDL